MNAKNGNIRIAGADFDYLRFGSGENVLIMLPGVGDGFKTAKGMALPFSVFYRLYARHFTVFAFSRRNELPEGFTTRDMAEDLFVEMDAIGIPNADVFGVSQGGMIAQQMAIHHPDQVSRLVLAVTASRPNDIMREALSSWLEMADRDDYRGILLDTAERSYTGAYLERGRMMNRMLAGVKPKDYSRFRILCRSCLAHESYDDLAKIQCPTLVIGADQDRVLGSEASVEMNERIPDSELCLYEGYSHGVYEQAKDFNSRVLNYLMQNRV